MDGSVYPSMCVSDRRKPTILFASLSASAIAASWPSGIGSFPRSANAHGRLPPEGPLHFSQLRMHENRLHQGGTAPTLGPWNN